MDKENRPPHLSINYNIKHDAYQFNLTLPRHRREFKDSNDERVYHLEKAIEFYVEQVKEITKKEEA